MNRRTGCKEWYGKITLPSGKAITHKCSTYREAQEWEVVESAAVANLSQIATISLLALVNEYLDDLAIRHTKSHYDDVRLIMRRFVQDIGPAANALSIKKGSVAQFVKGLAQEISPYRANRASTYIKRLYNWAVDTLDFPEPNPWRVKKFPVSKPKQTIAPLADFWKIYEIADEQQQRLLIIFFHTAARKSEILNLRWSDVDMVNRTVALTTRKRTGGEEVDKLPMTDEVLNALKAQRLETGFNEFVFVNPETGTQYTWANHMISNLCDKAKVNRFSFHAIRRLSASFVAERKPLPMVQALLRHQNLTTTAIYVKQLNGLDEEFNDVFKMTGPGNSAITPKERIAKAGAQPGA
jgi:integrase